jgi:Mn-dependent DtxR family transcriptional regulator
MTAKGPLSQADIAQRLGIKPDLIKENLYSLKDQKYLDMKYSVISCMNESIVITVFGKNEFRDSLN